MVKKREKLQNSGEPRHRGTRTPALLLGLAGLAGLALAPAAAATDFTWDGEVDNRWDGTSVLEIPVPPLFEVFTNWDNDGGPTALLPGLGDTAIFTGSPLETSIDLNGQQAIDQLSFAGTTDFTLFNGSLNLHGGVAASGSATHTLSADLTLFLAAPLFNIANTATVDIDGSISRAVGSLGNLQKTGTGTLRLLGSAANSFGTTTVTAGDLYLSKAAGVTAIPGNLRINGGEVLQDSADQVADDATLTIDSGAYRLLSVGETLASATVNSTGRVSVQTPGARLTTLGDTTVNVGGIINIVSGELEVQDDFIVAGGSVGNNGGSVYLGDAARADATAGWLTVSDADAGGTSGGHLRVNSGGTLNHGNAAVLGDQAGEFGQATVSGAGSSWSNTAGLAVGFSGQGTARVEQGATLLNNVGFIAFNGGSVGEVTVTGPGSTWTNVSDLSIGTGGQGTLRVEDGATLSNLSGYVGRLAGSTGVATITGSATTWTNTADLFVGFDGQGTLNIEDGATVLVGDAAAPRATPGWLVVSDFTLSGASGGLLQVRRGTLNNAGNAVLGDDANQAGFVTLTNAAARWNQTGVLYVGNAGHGELLIEDGADLFSATTHIARLANATGSATVTGPGSFWHSSGIIHVGTNASGRLDILDRGRVVVDNRIILYAGGSLTLDNATLEVDTIEHDRGGVLAFNDSTLRITRLVGDLVQTAGTLTSRDPLNGITITGDYQPDSTSRVQLAFFNGGALTPVFDQINIGGEARLAGTLELDTVNYFNPVLGQSFDIVRASAIVGGFDAYLGLDLGGGFHFKPVITPDAIAVEVIRTGDLTGEGQVDQSDLDALLRSFGQSADYTTGDWDADGRIDFDDVNIVLRNWTGPAAPSLTVPEPGGLACIVLSALGLVRRRSQR